MKSITRLAVIFDWRRYFREAILNSLCVYMCMFVCVCIRIWEEWIEIVTNSNNLPFHILLLVTCQHSFLIFSSFIGQFLFNHYVGNASCTNEKRRKGCSRHPAGQIKTTYAAGLSCYSRAQARGLLIWSYCFVDCRVGKKHENTYQDKMFLPLLITQAEILPCISTKIPVCLRKYLCQRISFVCSWR